MSNYKYMYPRNETHVCHLCKSRSDVCQMIGAMITQVLHDELSFLRPSGELNSKAVNEIVQLEWIHKLQPELKRVTGEFRRIFQLWSNCRSEVIEELTKNIGLVVKMKTGTNVVKACGQVTSIIGGILAIGGVLLAPETGGLSLSAWGIRVSLTARGILMGAKIADGAFAHLQSRQVAMVLEKDRKMTEQMEDAVKSLMSTNKLFIDAVDEFQRLHQWFGFKELSAEVKELKSETVQAKSALGVVSRALKSNPIKEGSKFVRGVSGLLNGIYVIMDTVALVKTMGDIQDGSRSDLQEHIMALTAVLVREHDILKKQFTSLTYQ